MKQNVTNELIEELMSSPDLDHFLKEYEEELTVYNCGELLERFFLTKELSKSQLAKAAGMSDVYLHQVFSGRRKPSRSRLLCICIGFSATLEETQHLLMRCGFSPLYPRCRRDAIVYYGILHNMTLFEINDLLFEKGEETLS